jgi:hypothetical protein
MEKAKAALVQALGVAILLGALAGLLAVVFIPFELWRVADARAWPSRPGIVTFSSASPVFSRRRGPRWTYVIRGRFQDQAGGDFLVTRVRYGEIDWSLGEARAKAVVARYPPGAAVSVYSSPAKPRTMMLEPFAPPRDLQIAFVAGAALLALPFLLWARSP